MKHIYLNIFASALASLTLAACGNEDIEPDTGVVAPVFTATIEEGPSRAYDRYWEANDEIGISTYVSGATTKNVNNVCHVTPDGDGKFIVQNIEEQIYYLTTSRTGTVTFNAYYPYVYIPSSTNTTIDVNTSDQTKQKSFDMLFAKGTGTKESPDVELEFVHTMSKVTFVFRNGNDFDVRNIVSYRLNDLCTTAKFNITTGGFNTPTNRAPLSVNLSDIKDGEPVTPLIVLPQTVSGTGTAPRPVKLEIVSSDGQIYTVDLSFPNNQLVKGTNYKFTITVNRTGLSVNECTIENWTDKVDTGWGAGTAASADDPEE